MEPSSATPSDPEAPVAAPSTPAAGAPVPLAERLPLGIVVGLVVGFVAFRIVDFAGAVDSDGGYVRWSMISTGNSFAMIALVLAGGLELARRTTGDARRGAGNVANAAIALLVLGMAGEYYAHLGPPESEADAAMARTMSRWIGRAGVTCWLILTINLISAGWHAPAVRRLAAPLVIAVLVAMPYDFYARDLYGVFDGLGPLATAAIDTVIMGAWVALAIAVIVKGADRPAPAGWDRAARGLDRTASALNARLWIAAATVVLVFALFSGGGGPGLAKLLVVGVPTANAIAGIVLVAGVLGAAALAVPGAPRLQFLFAGAALAWVVAIQSVQVFQLLRGAFGGRGLDDGARELVEALPILLPVVLAAGLFLLVEGIRGIARVLGSDELRARAGACLVTVIVAQLVAIGGSSWLASTERVTRTTAIVSTLVVLGAAIATLISLATLCRAAAAGLRARTDLPTATVVTREP